MHNETLLERTIRLYDEKRIPIAQIAENANVKERWLYNALQGKYEDPGVNKIERVHAYLKRARTRSAKTRAA